MKTQTIQINIPIEFNQLIEIVRQLPLKEKTKLKEILKDLEDIDGYAIPEEHKKNERHSMKLGESVPSHQVDSDEAKIHHEKNSQVKALTPEQLIDRANRSTQDYLTGKYKTQEQLEVESKNW